jgi:ElaB/YqjD/DUF883 family membrane-anchored ribosome-binding protein
MTARSVKSSVDDAVTHIHNGVADAHEKIQHGVADAQEAIDENIDAVSDRLVDLEKQLRRVGDLIVENAKTLGKSASKQAQMHPLAAFGVAFLAGVTVAKLLRR